MLAITLTAALALDAATAHCAGLSHPSEELARAIMPNGSVTAVETGQYQRRGVVYNRLLVPADAVALCHSHPEDGGSILPGPGDWAAVKEDRPSYIAHQGRLIVLYQRGGHYYAKAVVGQLTAKEQRKLGRDVRRANY